MSMKDLLKMVVAMLAVYACIFAVGAYAAQCQEINTNRCVDRGSWMQSYLAECSNYGSDASGKKGCSRGMWYECVGGNDYDSRKCTHYVKSCGNTCNEEDNPNQPHDTTLTACVQVTKNGRIWSNIYEYRCRAEGTTIMSCNGKTNISLNTDGTLKNSFEGSCSENGCTANGQLAATNGQCKENGAECYSVIGYKCYMRDRRTGKHFTCDCDGSCAVAQQNLAAGVCVNPAPPEEPTPSDTAGMPSPSSSPSSSPDSSPSSSPSSSPDSSPSSSAGDDPEQCDQCNTLQNIQANTEAINNNTKDISQWTQNTMENTINIKNSLIELGVDVSNIKQNTGSAAQSASDINNKLNLTNERLQDINNNTQRIRDSLHNTNSLLDNGLGAANQHLGSIQQKLDALNLDSTNQYLKDIRDKWGDTATAGAKILDWLKGNFGDTANPYNPSDTAGSGGTFESLKNEIDSLSSGDYPEFGVGDSVDGAVSRLHDTFLSVKDSLGGGVYSDSLGRWTGELTGNGVLSGDGSDQCPNVLQRDISIKLPFGGGSISEISLGNLGRFLCSPIGSTGQTYWALARVVIRCLISILCMLWIYRAAIGATEGQNEED